MGNVLKRNSKQHQQQLKSITSKQRLQYKNINFTKLNSIESSLNANNKSIILNELPNYIALFDYDKATKDDMTIRKNDQLIVIDKT